MSFLSSYIRRRGNKPYVRPWALATPIVVILVCLPLLRPLRHPGQSSFDEDLRLATISAIVEHHNGLDAYLPYRLAIDQENGVDETHHVIRVGHHIYSDQPPMMAFLLSGPYWVLHAMGYRLRENYVLVPFLLTMLGVTIPAAGAAGAVYRMARIFELPRYWRAALAAFVIFGTGMISYAVVLNAHVPAAALVLASAGCLVHLTGSKAPARGGGWVVLAGFCAALAATIDLPAVFFLVAMVIVAPCLRMPIFMRIGGVLLYMLGAAGPILLHAMLTVHLTGDLLPGALHQNLLEHAQPVVSDDPYASDEPDDLPAPPTFWQIVGRDLGRSADVLFGDHGLLVHFPAIILGIAGVLAVMHRHWPPAIKALAGVSLGGIITTLLVFTAIKQGTATAEFANRWLMVFVPILFFWIGAWLRRKHHPAVWAVAAVLVIFSVIVSLIGATDPMPREGYNQVYTPVAALHRL